MIAIGIHVHEQPKCLLDTLAALRTHTAPGFELLLLPDGPDPQTRDTLARLSDVPQLPTEAPKGAPACFNRLAQNTTAEIVILLESGSIVGPGWLDRLTEALAAGPRHGLASPSTNRAWNQLAAFPDAGGDEASIARTAADAERRFGARWQNLAPLWDIGDFCLAAKRAVIDAIGGADEAYGQGPCWEMDYAIRAVRAGFIAVWAQGAYVFRHPFTSRRQREEARRFEDSRRRYQDKFCGLRLIGQRTTYAQHCHGDSCPHFAPPAFGAAASAAAARPAAPPPDNVRQLPLVSCIMPTSGRPDWAPQAIQYFLRQDYPNLELVIIDASRDNLVAQIPDDPRIRPHRIPSGCSIGTMRNVACELARGDIIIHWDDDDWYAPNRITAQVQPILDGAAEITGLTDTRFFALDTWRFWRCTPYLHRRLFVQDVHGGTLAFRRSLFSATCRYPDLSLAEDAGFLQSAVSQGARLARVPGANLFVYVRHAHNAWAFPCGAYLDPRGWLQDSEPGAMAGDRIFYAARSLAKVRANPPPLPPDVAETAGQNLIGMHVHAEPDRGGVRWHYLALGRRRVVRAALDPRAG